MFLAMDLVVIRVCQRVHIEHKNVPFTKVPRHVVCQTGNYRLDKAFGLSTALQMSTLQTSCEVFQRRCKVPWKFADDWSTVLRQ